MDISSGRARVSRSNFTHLVVEMYQLRKQVVHLVASQQSIRQIVSRTLALFLGFLTTLLFLIMIGLPANTIIISGVGVLASCTVILSE